MVRSIEWNNGRVVMLDQRLLPGQEVYRVYRDDREVANAIRDMVIRGAPAIGVAAAMGVALGARKLTARRFADGFERVCTRLARARPTAVNLFWAIDRMRRVYRKNRHLTVTELRDRLEAEAMAIHEEDVEANRRLGAHGQKLLPKAGTVLTYCNTGSLATGGYGTALGVIRAARAAGKDISVLAAETRPYLQGARLTAWECRKERIPVTVVSDNAIGALMERGEIQAAIVGTDRTAANGDVGNKIGTYMVAVLASRHGIPFYVAAPSSSIDLDCPSGTSIPIEERPPGEVTHVFGKRVVPEGVAVRNPAFDVTPATLVSAIVTEHGIARRPYRRSFERLLRPAKRATKKKVAARKGQAKPA